MLERVLTTHRKVEVLNAGFSGGHDPDTMYAWLVAHGLTFKPDLVIYGFYIGNDLTGLSQRSESRWFDLDEMGLPRKVRVDAVTVDGAGRLRSTRKNATTVGTEGIYRVPLLRESHLAVGLGRLFDHIVTRRSKLAWSWDIYSAPFITRWSNSSRMSQDEIVFKKVVRGMHEMTRRSQAEFLVLMIPCGMQYDPDNDQGRGRSHLNVRRDYYREITPWFEEQKIPTVNALEAMRSEPANYFPDTADIHCGALGYKLMAHELARHPVINSIVAK